MNYKYIIGNIRNCKEILDAQMHLFLDIDFYI